MTNSARTLAELASLALTSSPAAQAVDYEGNWSCWGDLNRVSRQVADLIAASGLRTGAPIAFVPRNRPAAIAAELAMLALGRSIQMIYAFQSPRGIARDIQKLGPGLAVLMAEDLSEEVLDVLKADGIAAIALRSTCAEAVPGFEKSARRGEADNGPMRIEILTSGTTGPPKRYSLHESAILGFIQEPVLVGAPETRSAVPPTLNYFPLGNLSGVYITLATLLNGLRLTLLDRFTLERWRNYVVRFRPPSASIPPTYFQALLDSDIAPEDLSSLKAMNAGASPLDPLVQRRFEERFNIPVLVSYGATEFGGRVAQMTPEDRAAFGARKLGSVGRPFGGARFRIVDPETGEMLRCGQEGILEVISPRVGPGWIRTADIGLIDDDGFLFLRGRADSAIMRGGFKILPETIEQALLEHPAVVAAAVVGVPDRRLGQAPAAAVKLRPQTPAPSIAELEAHLRDRLYATHIPIAWRFVDNFPLTMSMKVSKPGVAGLFERTQEE